MVTCGTCRHWRSWWPEKATGEADEPGVCGAVDRESLPHAWRYAPREVMGVSRDELSACPMYERAGQGDACTTLPTMAHALS